MKTPFIIASLLVLFSFISCCRDASIQDKNLITKRIQYDVQIKNIEPDMDWWIQNIEGSNREQLVKNLMQQVASGKVKAYDFLTCKPFSNQDIKNMMRRTDSISLERTSPPYQMYDTVVVTELHLSEITRLRFLEEWYIDKSTLKFTKKVAGICPMLERRSDSGELRGYKPLFWVFFDDKYPAELQSK